MNISSKQYAQTWYDLIAEKKDAKQINKKMLSYLNKKGQLSKLGEIMRYIEDIEFEQTGLEHVSIVVARDMPDEDIKKIAKTILKTDKMAISKKINPDLIAGMQIKTKNKRWDLSLKSQLRLLSKKISQ